MRHDLDDWGPEGGHDWPDWHHQMWGALLENCAARLRVGHLILPS